jgi:hypothetical protein
MSMDETSIRLSTLALLRAYNAGDGEAATALLPGDIADAHAIIRSLSALAMINIKHTASEHGLSAGDYLDVFTAAEMSRLAGGDAA